MHKSSIRQHGLTLIEAMIAVAVLAILAGIAMPGMEQLMRAARLRTAVSDLSTDFALARIVAVSRNSAVVVCPSDGLHCLRDSDWTRGWMVFSDSDRNLQPDQASDIITVRQARNDDLRIGSSAGRAYLRYLPDGMSAGSNLTISICESGQLAARVIVNNAGRVRTERPKVATHCPS